MNVLLTPGRIGNVEIKNRIVMPPMTTRLADEEGFVTEHTVNYYMARVRGGVGLITVEMASPTRTGRHRRRELGIYDDRFLRGLTLLTAAIHAGGAKASIQLGHGASGVRGHERDHHPQGDDARRYRVHHRGLRGGGGARRKGRLRLRRDS